MNNDSNKVIKLGRLKDLSLDALIEAYRNGYSIEETLNKESSLNTEFIEGLSTCPSSMLQNSMRQITITPSGGTPPYTINLKVDGAILSTWTGVTGQIAPFLTFNQPLGSHTYTIEAIDSCSTPKSITDSCVITITSAATTGTISTSTTPQGAKIFIDGVDMGAFNPLIVTPYDFPNIQTGTHAVVFRKSGYQDCAKSVNVIANTIIPVSCVLTPIETCPTNLAVSLNIPS